MPIGNEYKPSTTSMTTRPAKVGTNSCTAVWTAMAPPILQWKDMLYTKKKMAMFFSFTMLEFNTKIPKSILEATVKHKKWYNINYFFPKIPDFKLWNIPSEITKFC